jgi:uncharacterized membrane-anchored protein YitT (DUF2179 family)
MAVWLCWFAGYVDWVAVSSWTRIYWLSLVIISGMLVYAFGLFLFGVKPNDLKANGVRGVSLVPSEENSPAG